jgi:hypothetical protein
MSIKITFTVSALPLTYDLIFFVLFQIHKFPPFINTPGFMTALDFRIQSIRSGIGGKKLATKKQAKKLSADSYRKMESGTVDGAELFEFRSTRFRIEAGQHAACMNAVAALSDDPSTAEVLENR